MSVASMRDLAKDLLSREEPLVDTYATLAQSAVTAVEKELTGYLLRYQQQQIAFLKLFQGELPHKFLGFARIINNEVKFRQGPGGNHPLIRELNNGEPCIIMEFRGFWGHIQLTDGTRGYVFKDYLLPEDGASVDRPAWQKKS